MRRDPKERKIITVVDQQIDIAGRLNGKTTEEAVAIMQELHQQYLEHSFLYQRRVAFCSSYDRIRLQVTRQETDSEYNERMVKRDKLFLRNESKRIAKAEKERQQQEAQDKQEYLRLKAKFEGVDLN